MWRMNSGDRTLTDAEWAVFAAGLGALWDLAEDDFEGGPRPSETGVRTFDELQREQKIALLADVALALRDPSVPAPPLTAATEGAVAAVFAMVRSELQDEIDEGGPGEGSPSIRSLVLAAQQRDVLEEGDVPAPSDTDMGAWGALIDLLAEEVLWDADYDLADEVMDLPPEQAQEVMEESGIDPAYFTVIVREPDGAGLVAARQQLARLLARPVPDDDGCYPALIDHYHDLAVGPCSPGEIEAWEGHPWLEVRYYAGPAYECDYPAWRAELAGALPPTPFDPASGPEAAMPPGARAEPRGDRWVIRDDRAGVWCDLLENCWATREDDEVSALTFPTREEAEAASRRAERMYAERAARRAAALSRLGLPDDRQW